MKSPFSRFFGSGVKEEQIEEQNEVNVVDPQMATEEVIKIPIEKIIANRYQP